MPLRRAWQVWRALPALLLGTTATAQVQRLDGDEFTQRVWTSDQGLPGNSVTSLLQTPDGFLWVGTFGGLARFDGVRFQLFDVRNTPALKSDRITALIPDGEWGFWVVSEQDDLARFDGTSFRAYDKRSGAPVDKATAGLLERDGYWIAGERAIYRVSKSGAVRRWGNTDGVPAEEIRQIARDDAGAYLFATSVGLFVLRSDLKRIERLSDPVVAGIVNRVSPRAAGGLWVIGEHGIAIWERGVLRRFGGDTDPPGQRGLGVSEAPDGSLWIATANHGLERWRDGQRVALPLGTAPGVDARTRAVLVEREGNIWFAPNGGGLVRWAPARVTSLTKADGLFRDDTWSIVQDRAGTMWVSAWVLHRVRGRRVDTIAGFSGVSALHPDADGSLWIGHEGGLTNLAGNTRTTYVVTPPMKVNAIRAIYRDRSGRVFIGRNGGVLELTNGVTVDALNGELRSARGVSLITEDRAGALYFGGSNGLRVWRGGKMTHWTTANGLPHDQVRTVHETANSALWIGTYGGGLVRLSAGRFARVSTRDGLVEDAVSRIIDDGYGNFWLLGNRGVSRVRIAELDSVANGQAVRVSPVLFGVGDGMPTNETEGWIQWAGWRATDGRLWIPTIKGVAIIDPTVRHTTPPPVAVTEVIVNGATISHGAGVRLAPGSDNLELRYTALSYAAPEKVRFKYRLEGYDDEWIEAGDRRAAYYSHVPPGDYTFRVIASNDDGVWNTDGARLSMTLEPHFWQRRVVWALGVLLLAAAAAYGVRWRLRLLQARLAREQAMGERLREVDRLKDEFLANTSHELRTPLNGIIGLAQSLERGVAGPLDARVREDLHLIASSGQRLSRLVNDILDYTRLLRRDLVLHPTAVDVESAVRVSIALARPMLARDVTLTSDVASDLPPAWADEDRLQQILLNLLGNACKFTREGFITVTVQRAGDRVEIAVSDTGIGIPADQHERIFDAFIQGDASTTRAVGGTGLGLAVTRRLLELHGGTIRVESTPAMGSRFTVALPVSDLAVVERPLPQLTAPRTANTPAPNGHALADMPRTEPELPIIDALSDLRPRILVVDDDAVNARVLAQFLALDGYAVDVATNGPDGIAAVQRHPPSLVLLDLMMPGMDGFTACARIRDQHAMDVLPVILVTARNTVDALVAGLTAGANDFIPKPVVRDELLTRVRTHLALAEANRQLRATRNGLEEEVRARTEDLRESNGRLAGANDRLAVLNGELEGVNSQLATANNGLRSILDRLRTGVIATDASGVVVFASRTAEQILECSADDAIGVRWESLVRVDDADRAALMALVAAPPSKRERLATRVRTPSGRRYWVQIEVDDDPRGTGGRIIHLNDVSDLYALPPADGSLFHGLVGASSAMQLLCKEIGDIAPSQATVLIEGETGTGKELVARAIHAASARKAGPFVALNCAGLAESILASQLFGHRRGAFTGAVADQQGLIEAADGGTLFLDEIGDIPLAVQAALLRTLQEREVVRLGESRPRRIDVRIVAATHRDLVKRTAEGLFREDFLYRVRVARIRLPALRQRLDDVPALAGAFLRTLCENAAAPLEISSDAMEFLLGHSWPGNVRELRSALEHAAVRCRGGVLRPGDLPPEILEPSPLVAERSAPTAADARQQLIDALVQTGGNRSATARLLGISRPTLYARLRSEGLIDE